MVLHIPLPQWVVEHYIPRWYFTSLSLSELISITYPDGTSCPPPSVSCWVLHTHMVLHVPLPQWVVECCIPTWYFTTPSVSEMLRVAYPHGTSCPPPSVSCWVLHTQMVLDVSRPFVRRLQFGVELTQELLQRFTTNVRQDVETSSENVTTNHQTAETPRPGVTFTAVLYSCKKANLNSTRGSHLPVGHSNNVAVHPVNTGLVYHPLHRRNEHLAPLQTETLLGRKLLGEKLLESGEKPSAFSGLYESRSKTSQKCSVQCWNYSHAFAMLFFREIHIKEREIKRAMQWDLASRIAGHWVRTLHIWRCVTLCKILTRLGGLSYIRPNGAFTLPDTDTDSDTDTDKNGFNWIQK